jgi:hypothetical protein
VVQQAAAAALKAVAVVDSTVMPEVSLAEWVEEVEDQAPVPPVANSTLPM